MPESALLPVQNVSAPISTVAKSLPVQPGVGYHHGYTLQPKLSIGSVDDPLEHEADAIAERVMRMPGQTFIQRKCAHCEEEEKDVQRKPLSQLITPFIQAKSETTVNDDVADSIYSSKGSGTSMDQHTGSFMSSRFGADFSNVKVHTDSEAVQLNRGLNAKAFTVGNDVYFNQGQYQPHSNEGKQLLAHELTHVIQQGNGMQEISRATYTVGTRRVNIDYGNVVFHDNIYVYDSEIESRYTGITGQPATLIQTDVAALSNPKKRWVLYAIDLLSDNPLASLNKVEAIRRLITYAPGSTFNPLDGFDYRNPRFENEVLRVSGWFELALTAGLAVPGAEDQRLLNVAYNNAASGGGSAVGSACPVRSASDVLDETALRADLPPLMQTFLQGQVSALNGRGIQTQNITDISPIADTVQQQALRFFSPYIGNSSSRTFLQNWRFSSHLTASTAPGAIGQDVLLAYLVNRARGRGTDSGLFQRVKYDSRCDADIVVFNDIIDQLFIDATVQTQLAAIMSWQSFTGHGETSADTVVNLQHFSNQNECTSRWRLVNTLCHELVHPYVHSNFYALNRGRRIITEGFTEVLGDQLYTSLRTRALANPAFRAMFEGGLTAGVCTGVDIPEADLNYGDDGRFASGIRAIVGDARFRAAYFLGQTRLAGLQPKLMVNQVGDEYEQEADAMADKVMQAPEISFAQNKHLPSANNSQPLTARQQPSGFQLILRQEEEPEMSEEERRRLSEASCIGVIPGQGEQRYEFSQREQSTITFLKYAAASLMSRALLALSSGDQYVLRVARRIFHQPELSSSFLIGRIERIRDTLNSATFLGGTCSDESCYTPSVAAHAMPSSNEIVICKRFFTLPVGRMRSTIIHEAAHNVGIDSARVLRMDDETYCSENFNDPNECRDPCDNISDHVNNVDAWARCIECVANAY